MNKGFTLIEMIAVVVIVSLISLLTVPAIINQISNKKSDVKSTTEEMIYQAAELYMQNNIETYSKSQGETYTIRLDELVNSGYLSSPIIDYETGNEISLTKCVQTTVNNYNEYGDFELTDNC